MLSIRVGDLVVGLRSDDASMLELVRAAVAPSLVDGYDTSPNLSLFFGERHGPARDLHALYRGSETLFRTASPGRVVRAAIAALEGYVPAPEPLLPLEAPAVVGPRGVVLVKHVLGGRLRAPEGLLARSGWQYFDRPVRVDVDTLEVVVAPSSVALDHDALADIDRSFPRRSYEPVVDPGRYPLAGILTVGATADHLKLTSPARRLASLVELVRRPGEPVRVSDLELLRAVERQVEVVRVLGETEEQVLGALARLA